MVQSGISANSPTPSPLCLLRLADVKARTGLSRASVYRLRRDGRFPAPVRLTERTVGWRSDDIDQWIAERERI